MSRGAELRELTAGDRRELRSIVKKQFAVLRADLKRREGELSGDVEADILRRYRQQDQDIQQAREELARVQEEFERQAQAIARTLTDAHPELTVRAGWGVRGGYEIRAADQSRAQAHRAALAAIPGTIAQASADLDQQELDLLRELTVSALDSDAAAAFMSRIPTVGRLVSSARMSLTEGIGEKS